MTVALIGATGFTGSLCARELVRRGVPTVWIARSRDKLDALAKELGDVPRRVASPDDPASLDAALAGASVILNTVGPFEDLGEPVVKAAIAHKLPYVDTTGEQGFMAAMLDRHDAAAKAANIAVICAGAFEYSVGDCVAAIAIDDLDGADSVDTYYLTRSGSVSHGTAKSAARAIAGRGYAWVNGARARERVVATTIRVPGDERNWSAVSFACGEALHIPRKRSVATVHSWVGLPPGAAKWTARLRFALPVMRLGPVRALADRLIDRKLTEPSPDQRAAAQFVVAAHARKGDRERWCVVHGSDPYALTAVLTVEHALRLQRGAIGARGVVSTAMAFDPADFLRSVGLEPVRS